MTWKTVLHKYDPAVPSAWLLLLAGVAWTAVGGFLCVRALGWLEARHDFSALLLGGSGAVVAVVWNRLMFTNVAQKNVGRIIRLPERACVFAFTAWKGYGMIALMVPLGIFLRNSSLPKHYLAPAYLAMGGALLLSSAVFYRNFMQYKTPA